MIGVVASATILTSPWWAALLIINRKVRHRRGFVPTRCHHNYTLDGRRKWRMYQTKGVRFTPPSPFVNESQRFL